MKTFSIITPTFNSGKVIKKYFESIVNQDYDLDKVEILIIDGGSTDDTLDIAKFYSSKIDIRIFTNEKRLPEYAKAIGINNSIGEFCIFQDSDEALVNKNSFRNREVLFTEQKSVNNLVLTELLNPPGYSGWGKYYSDIGDPFSTFMFGASFNYLDKFSKNYKTRQYLNYAICFVSKREIFPLIDGVQTFRRLTLLELTGKNIIEVEDVLSISSSLILDKNVFAVMKNDSVLHYSSSSFKGIINKIKSRIVRNVFKASDAGFVGRENKFPIYIKIKKFLFIPYSFSIILPALDGIVFYIRTKNIYFLMHFIFTFYTGFMICFFSVLKILGFTFKIEQYG